MVGIGYRDAAERELAHASLPARGSHTRGLPHTCHTTRRAAVSAGRAVPPRPGPGDLATYHRSVQRVALARGGRAHLRGRDPAPGGLRPQRGPHAPRPRPGRPRPPIAQYRAERAAEALHTSVRHLVTAIRGGAPVELDVTELVPGDVLLLQLGAVVPADIRLLEAAGDRSGSSTRAILGLTAELHRRLLIETEQALTGCRRRELGVEASRDRRSRTGGRSAGVQQSAHPRQ
jgi:hypothetical protein